jgi:hypothetical protein
MKIDWMRYSCTNNEREELRLPLGWQAYIVVKKQLG